MMKIIPLLLLATLPLSAKAQVVQRKANYYPDGKSIVCVNGTNRYTRALYSNNSFFRVETSDRPIFGIYQKKKPCANVQLRVSLRKTLGKNKYQYVEVPLDSTDYCESRYEAGMRTYILRDQRLGNGEICIMVIGDRREDGGLWRIETKNFSDIATLTVSLFDTDGKSMMRSGDIGSFATEGRFEASSATPFATGTWNLNTKATLVSATTYFTVNGGDALSLSSADVPQQTVKARFDRSEQIRQEMASSVTIDTPDSFLNPLGGNLVMAADGAWDGEVWNHGAVGWRMPLPGWRAAYAGDFLGMPDKQKTHFNAYAASMVTTEPMRLPHEQDSTNNLARGTYKWGTPMYSNGYICRNPRNNHQFHHYDMNLPFIDELLWHFQFDADTTYLRQRWNVLTSHLEWEKRVWDPDNDGLYDAYCCIWASDALQYNSGAVTHSSAYNYRGNRLAARIATLLGEDPKPYQEEADRILNAMNARLWMADKGVWAEFQDFMGLKRLHDVPALWTIYTAIDSRACSLQQAYDATGWIGKYIPHIPFTYKNERYETLATSNWAPYEWSINNVAMAEVMHTVLAFYESGRPDEATKLLKANIVDFQYAGISPGNFGQLSSLDRNTGEGYRDFSDVTGIASRAVIQGLFGITPQALEGDCFIRPGFPQDWDSASIHTPYMDYSFHRKDGKDIYEIHQRFVKPLRIVLQQNRGKGIVKEYVGTQDSVQVIEVPTYRYEVPVLQQQAAAKQNHSAVLERVDAATCHPVDITKQMNSNVTDIFKNEYLSPRSPYTTLSLPKQGIGDWCSTKRTADIDDAALRNAGGTINVANVPFLTPADGQNIIYTSLWDNYPDSVTVPLKGKANRVFLLMAGSTNPMQSQFDNGEVILTYKDGTTEKLMLRNPDNWCPIEQDYDDDPWAFRLPQERPFRLALKTGKVSRTLAIDMNMSNKRGSSDEPSSKNPALIIPGGAAQLLTIQAQPNKKLKSLTVKTTANDVVIGLLGVTLDSVK